MSTQTLAAQIIGLREGGAPSSATTNLNAAANRHMVTFIPTTTVALSKVKFFVSSVVGSPIAADATLELYAMPTGAIGNTTGPTGAAIESKTASSAPSAGAWMEFTGFTTSLTAGTMYALVMKNVNGTPASNSWQVRYITSLSDTLVGSGNAGWTRKTSTDSGATWGGQQFGVGGVRIEYADGTFAGFPASQGGVTAVGSGIYSTRELGAKFTTPSQVKLRVIGMGARFSRTGSPTGDVRFRLYNNTTLLATTASLPQYQNQNYQIAYFSSVLELTPGAVHRAVMGETTQSDTSANRINLYEYDIENNATSKAMMPLGGWVKTYWDGSSWTDTDTNAISMWMILDSTQPFGSIGFSSVF